MTVGRQTKMEPPVDEDPYSVSSCNFAFDNTEQQLALNETNHMSKAESMSSPNNLDSTYSQQHSKQ